MTDGKKTEDIKATPTHQSKHELSEEEESVMQQMGESIEFERRVETGKRQVIKAVRQWAEEERRKEEADTHGRSRGGGDNSSPPQKN